MEKKISLIAKNEDSKSRVDILINKNQNDISRSRIKNLILNKKLKINNKIVLDPAKKINTNDLINLIIPIPVA